MSTSKISLYLPDRSKVDLFPNSSIHYKEDLKYHKRNVVLSGTANFKVYKDKHRQFSVVCNNVETIALGTEFLIRSNNHKIVVVSLIEGKILVHNKTLKKKRDYYLLPGNSIAYNDFNMQFKLFNKLFNAKDDLATSINPVNLNISASVNRNKVSSNEVQFLNNSLSSVLNNLARRYNVKILYSTNKIDKINFSGTIKQSNSIHEVLNDIAIMNDLKLEVDTLEKVYKLY